MTRRLRYLPQAEASLDAIADWTFERFGRAQARRYVAGLRAACERIGEGTASGRSVRDVLAPKAPEDLRFVRAGSHVVLFRERGDVVEVTDVLHEAMDLAGRVGEAEG